MVYQCNIYYTINEYITIIKPSRLRTKMRRIQKNSIKKPLILTTILVIIVLLISGTVFAYKQSLWPFLKKDNTQKSANYDQNTNDQVNYSAPTQQEVDSSQDAKKNTAQEQNGTQQEDTSTKKVSVGISYATINSGNLEIRAFTPDVIEGTGTCTATAVMGTKEFTTTSKAFVDATSSICKPLYIDAGKLEAGTWNVTVSYSSPTSSGTSNSVEVTK